jgi:hypothetical protein
VFRGAIRAVAPDVLIMPIVSKAEELSGLTNWRSSQAEAGGNLDGGVFPLLMSILRTGSIATRRWR